MGMIAARMVIVLLLLSTLVIAQPWALAGWSKSRRLLQQREGPPLTFIAAELARLSARLAELAAARHRVPGHHGTGHFAAATLPSHNGTDPSTPAADPPPKIDTGMVQSIDLNFKGYNVTIVGLKNDEYVSGHMYKYRVPFGQDLLGKLMDLVSPGDTVVDAGANLGTYSTFLAAKVGPTGRVVSFEPQARMFQLLCTNLILNSLLQMQPKNMALSYEAGVLHMMSKVLDGSSANIDIVEAEKKQQGINYGGMRLGVGGEEVATRTLDSFNLTGVKLIKVDVQWAERLMFYGAQATIKSNLPAIAYETVQPNVADDLERELAVPEAVRAFNITEFLVSLGYKHHPEFVNNVEDKVMLPPGHPLLAPATSPQPQG